MSHAMFGTHWVKIFYYFSEFQIHLYVILSDNYKCKENRVESWRESDDIIWACISNITNSQLNLGHLNYISQEVIAVTGNIKSYAQDNGLKK